MKLYSKIILIISFLASVIILIVGAVKSINGMIIGGVIGLITSALITTGAMIQSNTTVKEQVKIVNVNNPIPDV